MRGFITDTLTKLIAEPVIEKTIPPTPSPPLQTPSNFAEVTCTEEVTCAEEVTCPNTSSACKLGEGRS